MVSGLMGGSGDRIAGVREGMGVGRELRLLVLGGGDLLAHLRRL